MTRRVRGPAVALLAAFSVIGGIAAAKSGPGSGAMTAKPIHLEEATMHFGIICVAKSVLYLAAQYFQALIEKLPIPILGINE